MSFFKNSIDTIQKNGLSCPNLHEYIVNNNLEDEFYDSLKLLYIIDNNIDNIQNYSTTNILNFISNIIQTSNIPILKIQDFNKLENFITLQKN